MPQEYHIVAETPAGSGNYTATGEIVNTGVADAVARCVVLNAGGGKHGMWVYESVAAKQILPVGGIGPDASGTTLGTRARRLPSVGLGGPTNVDVPYASQSGSTLTCTMGNWEGEPTEYWYQWKLDGANAGTNAPNYAVQPADVGKSATCTVTARNAQGETVAPPSNAVVVA
jgi:hypothetical protein